VIQVVIRKEDIPNFLRASSSGKLREILPHILSSMELQRLVTLAVHFPSLHELLIDLHIPQNVFT
jgi:hypothetical protein